MKIKFEYLNVIVIIDTIKEKIKIISNEDSFITNAVFKSIKNNMKIDLNNYEIIWVKS